MRHTGLVVLRVDADIKALKKAAAAQIGCSSVRQCVVEAFARAVRNGTGVEEIEPEC